MHTPYRTTPNHTTPNHTTPIYFFTYAVLEAGVSPDHIVVVAPETAEYRKASVVHTCFGESFLEIGCDFGPNVDRVRKSLIELGDVPPITNTKQNTEETTIVTKEGETKALTGATSKGGRLRSTGETTAERVVCLGIDKSENSIGIAVERWETKIILTLRA